MTQKEFADKYMIPLSTLRKWEQRESTPPPYVTRLIADTIPGSSSDLTRITGSDGEVFYYDKISHRAYDNKCTCIETGVDVDGVQESNLALYLSDLFERYYYMLDKFRRDCDFDRKEGIIWSR